ncbi:unnamed protein product [Aphanomyces euteiches]
MTRIRCYEQFFNSTADLEGLVRTAHRKQPWVYDMTKYISQPHMGVDNANFAKFCRECPQLVGDNFSPVDIDLTFVKVKAKGERRISYVMFLEALGIIATKKYPDKSLAVALPLLLEMNVSTLSCLETALSPGRTSWRRKSSLTDGHSTKATKLEREGALPDNQLIELAVHPPPVPIVSHMT